MILLFDRYWLQKQNGTLFARLFNKPPYETDCVIADGSVVEKYDDIEVLSAWKIW
jgi:hypothetical protein